MAITVCTVCKHVSFQQAFGGGVARFLIVFCELSSTAAVRHAPRMIQYFTKHSGQFMNSIHAVECTFMFMCLARLIEHLLDTIRYFTAIQLFSRHHIDLHVHVGHTCTSLLSH